ncbi:hypothetical protein H2203_000137 [Taxawa tesnikishii (nom. ined.)]|nr:hypothetical protein H2203_000137 [Dothideales sp. JES 119]
MERPLIKQAKAAEEVASGLHVFLEEVPQWATDISATISELFAVSSAFRTLDNADDSTQYGRGFYRIRDDLDTASTTLWPSQIRKPLFGSCGLTTDPVF